MKLELIQYYYISETCDETDGKKCAGFKFYFVDEEPSVCDLLEYDEDLCDEIFTLDITPVTKKPI